MVGDGTVLGAATGGATLVAGAGVVGRGEVVGAGVGVEDLGAGVGAVIAGAVARGAVAPGAGLGLVSILEGVVIGAPTGG